MTRCRLLAPPLIAFALVATAAAEAPIRWSLGPGEMIRYRIEDLPGADGQATDPFPLQRWSALGHELSPRGTGWSVHRLHQLPLALVMALPGRTLTARRPEHKVARRFDRLYRYNAVDMRGTLRHDGQARFADLPCQRLALDVTFQPRPGDPLEGRVEAGALSAHLYYHPGRGHILGVEAQSWIRYRHAQSLSRVQTKRYRLRMTVDLVTEVDGPRLQPLINQAIDDGLRCLLRLQQPDGHFAARGGHATYPLGYTALAAQTLLASGLAADHPAVTKAFAAMRGLPIRKTYGAAALLMALEARYAPAAESLQGLSPRKRLAALARIPGRVSAEDRRWAIQAVTHLLGASDANSVTLSRGGRMGFGERASWGYPQPARADNSNTQYALLGLLAATRLGVPIPPSAWRTAAGHWLRLQATDGPRVVIEQRRGRYVRRLAARARGWTYYCAGPATAASAYGSMTCAGIGSLAICRSQLLARRQLDARLGAKIDAAMRDGLAWLQQHWELRANPNRTAKPLSAHYYFLYGLERAAVLAGVERIGPHPWYREGAALLVGWQRTNGAWAGLADQCFALLFLKRATVPVIFSGPLASR